MKKRELKSLAELRKAVLRLKRISRKRLDEAVCDIIDQKGYALAVLLRHLPEFSPARQQVIAQKIEDFLYFHPSKGKKLVSRLKKACGDACRSARAQLLSAIADVSAIAAKADHLDDMGEMALGVLDSPVDYSRKAKALEILQRVGKRSDLSAVIKNMIDSTVSLGDFSNYQFFESSLLVVKRFGGEAALRLLISPNSDDVIKDFRMEWRDESPEAVMSVINQLQSAKSDFAQMALKVVDLSDFNLPFVSMIRQGLQHQDKWVRQAAAASMEKASAALEPESLSRLLNDPSAEVRLMAVSSLGGYSAEQTGDLLESLVRKPGETVGLRMNALYALYSQKNLPVLEKLCSEPDAKIALNAMGLSALLRPKKDGFADLMKVFAGLSGERATELQYYLLELADPEDIGILIDYHKNADSALKKENCISLIRAFLLKKAGPRLSGAISTLSDGEKKALDLLSAFP